MSQRKILLLENAAAQAAATRASLFEAGFQVAVSRHESDGLKRLVEWGPDVVLVSTAHPAGDFVEYCSRVRNLAPGVRLIVSSSLNRDRLFQQYPALQALVDGVLLRPYSHEEVSALIAADPVAARAPAGAAVVDPGNAALRAEFQRQLDGKFLEIQELKRHLEVANRKTPAPEDEQLQLENERLRREVEESKKKAVLAFATEQLRRSEVEVKLDNLLRMKKDFEFRVQNEIDDRTQEIEVLRGQLQELRERSDKEAGEHALLRGELERALVEKERIEERLHTVEAGAIEPAVLAKAQQRIAVLEAELSRHRALEVEGQGALADASAKLAILEASLAREQAAREEQEPLLAQLPALREQKAEAERRIAELRATHDGVRNRLVASENSTVAAQAELLVADESRAALARELEEVRAAHAEEERQVREHRSESAARTREVLERAAQAERRAEQVQAACAALEERLAASEAARIAVAAEAEAVVEKAGADAAAGAAELERVLVEKEQLEERLHTLEAAALEQAVPPEAAQRIEVLEAELSRQRALEAEGQVALADLSAKLAILEESLVREQAELVAANETRAALARELEEVRAAHAEEERLVQELRNESASRTQEALERAADAERRNEQLQAACAALEERVAASEAAASEAAERPGPEAVALRAQVEELNGELGLLRSQQEQAVAEQEIERRESAARLERALRDLEGSERQLAELRGELAAAAQAHDRENRLLAERAAAAEAVSRESGGQLEIANAALVAAREDVEARDQAARLQLEARQASFRELEERLAAQAVPEAVPAAAANPVQAELKRIQELLEEVISRARNEAVDHARRDAELSVRLQAALEERRLFKERFDRAAAEAAERERRSAALLQSAIDHGSLWSAERANLPAVVPFNPDPGTFRRRPVLVVLAVVALAVLLAVFGLRRASPPTVFEQQPVPQPQAGASPGAAVTPRAVWDRFTRSDTSGGVLVQATLRGEQELLAEVEADRAGGGNDEEVRAEFARRLSAFRFDTTYYVTVYLKNLAAGYPAYLDDLPGHFRLRDSSGKEVPAFLPPGHDKDHRIFSFGAGAPADLIYEASVSLGFDRAGLAPSASYLQLVVSDVGAASRRVLTWELE